MHYRELKEARVKFELFICDYVKTHVRESYAQVAEMVGISEANMNYILKKNGVRRIGGRPGKRPPVVLATGQATEGGK